MNKDRYFEATSRHEKVNVTQQVVLAVAQTGRFLKFDQGLQGWVEVPECTARQKVCQALQYRRRRDTSREDGIPSHNDDVHWFGEATQRHQSPQNVVAPAAHFPSHSEDDRLSELQQPMTRSHHSHSQYAAESKQAAIDELDSDFLSILRELSQGAHHKNATLEFGEPGSTLGVA
jgi:hypothetical protein